MKASLKFREEQKPLFKAKVPINILGLPFNSGVSAGNSKELCLSLGTFFDSGPAFRVLYRPNDAFNPFSFIVKTGIGHFGSPIDAPMTMSAEFNFLGNSMSNPRFLLHFKPQFGDFSLKKSQASEITAFSNESKRSRAGFEEEDSSLEFIEKPPAINGGEYFPVKNGGKFASLPLRSSLESALSGMELGAKTVLPIRNGAILKLRWGVQFPDAFHELFAKKPTAGILPRGIPKLVLNKIGLEHMASNDKTKEAVDPQGSADVAETCFAVKRQMERLRAENAVVGKALDDLRAEFANKSKEGRVRGEEGGARNSAPSNGSGTDENEMKKTSAF